MNAFGAIGVVHTLACLICSSILGRCYLHIPGVLFALRRRPFGTRRIPLGGRRVPHSSQIPLQPNLEFWDIRPCAPTKDQPTFADWPDRLLLSQALQVHGFTLEKPKRSSPYWLAYFCCRPDTLNPPAYRPKPTISPSFSLSPPPKIKTEKVKKEKFTQK